MPLIRRSLVAPIFKSTNDLNTEDIAILLHSLRIELRAHVLHAQLGAIAHVHPAKLQTHIVQHSLYFKVLRRSLRRHTRAVSVLRNRLALDLCTDTGGQKLQFIRKARQDGEVIVPVVAVYTALGPPPE